MKSMVFVLASNYSGSHYLSLMLGSHSQSVCLGEAKRLKRRAEKACYICRDEPDCELFAGINADNLHLLDELLFEKLPASTDLLIDNSKKPQWAERFLGDANGIGRRYIHLIRDPRALVRRWLQEDLTASEALRQRFKTAARYPARLPSLLLGPLSRVYTLRWLRQNQEITGFISRNNLDCQLVSYRDLVLQPQHTMGKLMLGLSAKFEATQLEHWNFKHHGTQKKDYVQQTDKSFFDLRWQTELSQAVQASVIELPEIKNYLDELGLAVRPDGLTSD
ncbi:MAG: sulfotransferase [Immundisolibacteraceae bacterium]|nr:sulfotransferase [Immundisolibacteraceae bacterium]